MNYNRESYKRTLILKYIIPALSSETRIDAQKVEDIIDRFGLKDMIKYQEIESPGPAMEGCMFFSISGVVHNYQYIFNTRRKHGTSIWNRRSFIFNGNSLLANSPRKEFIQLLEQSEVLYITYPNLLYLIGKYKDINDTISLQLLKQNAYHHEKNIMYGLDPAERVKEFRAENTAFIGCTNQTIQAMHTGISLRSYTDQLKKLRER